VARNFGHVAIFLDVEPYCAQRGIRLPIESQKSHGLLLCSVIL